MNRGLSGLLRWLLCALLLGLTGVPASALCRPETRVGGSPAFSSVFASQESAKSIGTPTENGGCGYDFASGVHKYLYGANNPVNIDDPSGQDGDEISTLGAVSIGSGLAGASAGATLTAGTAAEGTLIAAEATEVTETAVVAGETATAAEETVAKTTLRMLGKTVRGIIEQAKKIMNLAKDSPEKVVPMPRSVIPKVCANITTGFLEGQPFELRRVNAEQAAINREKAVGLLPSAGIGKSWDEYPFASGKDPEFAPLPATVAAVPWWENSVQGGIIAGCYKIEDIKVGMPYTVVVIP